MTNAARSNYAPKTPDAYSRRIGNVAEALDDITTLEIVRTVGDSVTLEARSQLVLVDGAATITMPDVAKAIYLIIVVKNTGTENVSVASSALIEGLTSLAVDPGESYSMFSTGTTWEVI